MPVPGPLELGRGVVIVDGDSVPEAWQSAEVVDVEGGASLERLHRAWLRREPIVARLRVDPGKWRVPESVSIEPWKVAPDLDLLSDRLHHLLWANNYDARNAITPQWWWSRKASRIGAIETPDGTGDVLLPDGRSAWIDGGPRSPMAGISVIHAETIELGRLDIAPPPTPPQPEIPLADDQLRAVAHTAGAARIVAPAGSGKTRVLTERLRHLLGDRKIERELVCAVAYNRRAQEELAQRCAAFRPRVVTLNALGWELLGRPRVLEERDVRRTIEGLVPKPTRRANVDPIGPYLEALATIRLGLADPVAVEDERDDVPGIADAFLPYRAALRERGAVDFDEQIYGAIERLLTDGDFRRVQQVRHRHLLVDEFQDLTPAHVLMLRLLAMPTLNVFGVGDDDQVIYGHAGADPAFLLGFDQLFPGAANHPLEVNYRCRPAVVDAARSLLRHNVRRIDKVILADREAGVDSLRIVRHVTEAGAEELVKIVRAHITSGRKLSDIAILTRVNSTLLAPQVALKEAGVLVEGGLDERVLDRTGVRAALAYMRIATTPEGFAVSDLNEVLRRPSRGLPQWIDKWFRGTTMTVPQLRRISSNLDDAKVSIKIDGLADDLEQIIRVAKRGSTRDVLRSIKEDVGLGQAMTLLDASASGSHLDDLEALEQVADLHPAAAGFDEWLRHALRRASTLDRDRGTVEEEDSYRAPPTPASKSPGVTLATVHKVKGQEWPVVVLFGMSDGLMPHRLSTDDEEERRVLHVGLTRGIEHVVVMTDQSRPSPFLAELDPTNPPKRGTRNTTGERGTARLATTQPTSKSPSKSPSKSTGQAAVARSAGDQRSNSVTKSTKLRAGSTSSAAAGDTVDAALLEQLRTWRSGRAKADGVPPYVVMHDKHLQALAASRPQDLRALGKIEGMGPRRIDLYADDLLALLSETDQDNR